MGSGEGVTDGAGPGISAGTRMECGMVESSVSGTKSSNLGLGAVLRQGWDARVGKNVGISAGCGSLFGGVLAIVRDAPSVANYALRTGLSWGVMSTPFFVLREIMSGARVESEARLGRDQGVKDESGSMMDELKDSGVAGLLTGYFGALWVHGPKVGKLLQWSGLGTVGGVVGDLGIRALGEGFRLLRRKAEVKSIEGKAQVGAGWLTWEWPVWFPVLKNVDMEYQELLKRKEVLEGELQEERRRIRGLLEQLERKEQLAATRRKVPTAVPSSPVTDVSTGDTDEE